MAKTVVIPIESSDLLGRVIGRESRNIRLIEKLAAELQVEVCLPVKAHSHCLILTGTNKHLVGCYLKDLIISERICLATIEEAFREVREEIQNEAQRVEERAI